jgi:hypothetical protein
MKLIKGDFENDSNNSFNRSCFKQVVSNNLKMYQTTATGWDLLLA